MLMNLFDDTMCPLVNIGDHDIEGCKEENCKKNHRCGKIFKIKTEIYKKGDRCKTVNGFMNFCKDTQSYLCKTCYNVKKKKKIFNKGK